MKEITTEYIRSRYDFYLGRSDAILDEIDAEKIKSYDITGRLYAALIRVGKADAMCDILEDCGVDVKEERDAVDAERRKVIVRLIDREIERL